MASISTKVAHRLTAGIKRFQPVPSAANARDANESDTVTIVRATGRALRKAEKVEAKSAPQSVDSSLKAE